VEIAPDSSFIAAGSWDDSIYALNMSGKELWNCSCGGNINSLDVSRDSSTIAAGSEAGAVYIFKRNATAFALLSGDASFLPEEPVKTEDSSLEENIQPVEETPVDTGGIENLVEDAAASSGDKKENIKTGGKLGMEELPSEKSSSSIFGIFDSIKFPLALLIGSMAGTVFFLKRRLTKRQEMDENTEDFENLEESDT